MAEASLSTTSGRLSAILTSLFSLLLCIVLCSAVTRDVTKIMAPRSSSSAAAAEFLMDYFVPEELPVGSLVGNVVVDFGLDLKYEPEMLGRLRFSFLRPTVPRHDTSSTETADDVAHHRHHNHHHQHQQQQQPQQRETAADRRESNGGTRRTGVVSGTEMFRIDARSGVIRTLVRVDRELVCPSATFAAAAAAAVAAHRGPEVCTFKLDVAVVVSVEDDDGENTEKSESAVQVLGVRVEILDINDNAPMFPDRKWSYRMSEAAEPGTEFVIPSAVDLDGNSRGNGIRAYVIEHLSDDDDDKFDLRVVQQLRRSSGSASSEPEIGPHHVLKLVLRERLDRERSASHVVVVSATDGGSPSRTGTMSVVVDVLDANDNRPEFSQQTYEVWVRESTAPGSVVLVVEATDRDDGLSGRVVYSLAPVSAAPINGQPQSVDSQQPFGVGPDTGRVYIKHRLDHETSAAFALTVTASDLGPDSLSAHASIIVHVDDDNDNAPTIVVSPLLQRSSARHVTVVAATTSGGDPRPDVAEDAEIGTFVAHLSVTDADSGRNGNVRCSVEEYGADDNDNGDVITTNGGSTETGNSFVGAAAVGDDGSANDVGEVSRAFELVRIYGATEYTLVTSSRLDRETRPEYRLAVTCRDDGWPRPATSSVRVTVVVVDRNDCVPTFDSASYSTAVFENDPAGRSVITVRATDCDERGGPNSRVTYRLDTTASNVARRYVDVDPDSGLVTLRESLDRETTGRLVFDILTVDDGSPKPLTGRTTVRLDVLDRDDQGPVFDVAAAANGGGGGGYRFDVDENRPIGTAVGAVRAIDGDLPPYNRVVYTLIDDDYQATRSNTSSFGVPFSVDRDNGIVTTSEVLDREATSIYRFRVRARSVVDDDNDDDVAETLRSTTFSSDVSVTVNVADVNDNRPKFTFPERSSTGTGNNVVRGDSMPTVVIRLTGRPLTGQVIARLRAFDADTPVNARPLFRLAGPSSSVTPDRRRPRDFDVDQFTGLVTVGPDLLLPVSALSASTVRRKLEVTVSDAAEPETVSDRAVLEVVLSTTTTTDDSTGGGYDGSFDGGIISAVRDMGVVVGGGDGGSVLASERLVLVLSCLLCVVLFAVAASVAALCVVRSSLRPLDGVVVRSQQPLPAIDAGRRESASRPSRVVQTATTTAAHGYDSRLAAV